MEGKFYTLLRGEFHSNAVCYHRRDEVFHVLEVDLAAPTGSSAGVIERDKFPIPRGSLFTWTMSDHPEELLIFGYDRRILIRDMTKHMWGAMSLELGPEFPVAVRLLVNHIRSS